MLFGNERSEFAKTFGSIDYLRLMSFARTNVFWNNSDDELGPFQLITKHIVCWSRRSLRGQSESGCLHSNQHAHKLGWCFRENCADKLAVLRQSSAHLASCSDDNALHRSGTRCVISLEGVQCATR